MTTVLGVKPTQKSPRVGSDVDVLLSFPVDRIVGVCEVKGRL